MAIDVLKTVDIIETMDNYLEKVRPPETKGNQLYVGYTIEDQSVVLHKLDRIGANHLKLKNLLIQKQHL